MFDINPSTPFASRIQITSDAALISAIPTMLGFYPLDSLVMVTVIGSRFAFAARVDLPAPGENEQLAGQLGALATQHNVDAVFLVIVGGGGLVTELPNRGLVTALCEKLHAIDVAILGAAWAPTLEAGQPWIQYDHGGESGVIPDPTTSELAAHMAFSGQATYRSRTDLAHTLAPDDDDALQRRADRIAALRRGATCVTDICDIDLVTTTIESLRHLQSTDSSATNFDHVFGCGELDDEVIARIAIGLTDSELRGQCLAFALDDAVSANRLWARMTQATPGPERVNPAWLLAFGAYVNGDGAIAQIALEIALEVDPHHPLATLLKTAIGHAIAPTELRAILTRACERPRSTGRRGCDLAVTVD